MKHKNLLFLTVVCFLLAAFVPTIAQEKDLMEMSLEELMNVEITTAGKKAEKIGDIPASVVVITREDIETYGYTTLPEILENIPGMYNIDDWTLGANAGVRGFWSGVQFDNIIIFVNGVHQVNDFENNSPLRKIPVPVEAIDRIEVIRGPMSVIYGQGAFFGAINIITNEVVDKPVSFVSTSYGSEKTKKLFLRAAGSEGDFHYTLNASLYDTYGIDEPLEEMMSNPSNLTSWEIPEDATSGGRLENNEKYVNFSGEFKGLSIDMSHCITRKEYNFTMPATEGDAYAKSRVTNISLKYRKELSDRVTIEGKVSHIQNMAMWLYDRQFVGFYGVSSLESNGYEVVVDGFFKSSKLDITSGLYYRSIYDVNKHQNFPPWRIDVSQYADNIVTQALFTQATYKSNRLRLVAGVRLEQSPAYELKNVSTSAAGEPKTEKTATYEKDNVEIIPRIASIFYLNDKNVIKFLYGKAINRPGFFQNVTNTLSETGPMLEPESIQTLELNYIGSLSSNFTMNASIFRNTLDKLITRVIENDPSAAKGYRSFNANAGKMVTTGAELTLNARPSENFSLELSGTYQKIEDKRDEYENVDVAYSPNFLGYLKAAYRTGEFSLALTGNYVGAMETYWDETIGDPTIQPLSGARIGEKIDGYFTLGANLRIEDIAAKGLFLNVRCYNLLDTEIRYPTYTYSIWADRGTLGHGRMFMISLGYKFSNIGR